MEVLWLENHGIVRADRVWKVLANYLSKEKTADWLLEVSSDTCMDTDVVDVWEAMLQNLKPEMTLKQVSPVELDGFVDVKK